MQLTAMAPSENQEALMHINDVRFGSAGKNILCLSCISTDNCATQATIDSGGYRTNLKKFYSTEFIKSDNITAFMTVKISIFRVMKYCIFWLKLLDNICLFCIFRKHNCFVLMCV